MKNAILEEIDKLKFMIMCEEVMPTKSDVELYQEWVDKLLCRNTTCSYYPFEHYDLCDNTNYAKYKTLTALVENLFHDKHHLEHKYHKDLPEIRNIIKEVVAMTMYIQEIKNSHDHS